MNLDKCKEKWNITNYYRKQFEIVREAINRVRLIFSHVQVVRFIDIAAKGAAEYGTYPDKTVKMSKMEMKQT